MKFAWHHDAEAAAAELEQNSALNDLALRGGMLMYRYICLSVSICVYT